MLSSLGSFRKVSLGFLGFGGLSCRGGGGTQAGREGLSCRGCCTAICIVR